MPKRRNVSGRSRFPIAGLSDFTKDMPCYFLGAGPVNSSTLNMNSWDLWQRSIPPRWRWWTAVWWASSPTNLRSWMTRSTWPTQRYMGAGDTDGYERTVSVIDIATFKEVKRIDVAYKSERLLPIAGAICGSALVAIIKTRLPVLFPRPGTRGGNRHHPHCRFQLLDR